ncbi:MAG: hypothetical protein AAFZ18_12085 [Myxococcota bacterium]
MLDIFPFILSAVADPTGASAPPAVQQVRQEEPSILERRVFLAQAPVGVRYEGAWGGRPEGDVFSGVSYQGLRVNGGVPLAREAAFQVGLGLAYHLRDWALDGGEGDAAHLTLHRFTVGLGARLLLDARWSLQLQGGLLYGSDLSEFRVQGVQPNLVVSAMYAAGPKWTFVFGAGLSRNLPDYVPLPFLGARWRPAPDVELEMYLPQYAQLEWRPFERWSLGVRAVVDGWGGAVEELPEFADPTLVRQLEVRTAARVQYTLRGPIAAYLEGGVIPLSEVTVHALDGQELARSGLGMMGMLQFGVVIAPR